MAHYMIEVEATPTGAQQEYLVESAGRTLAEQLDAGLEHDVLVVKVSEVHPNERTTVLAEWNVAPVEGGAEEVA